MQRTVETMLPLYDKHIEGYKKWKQGREAQHEQTKALRRLKAKHEAYDAELKRLNDLLKKATAVEEIQALNKAIYSLEVE